MLADFDAATGANPEYMSLVQGPDGNLYGTTSGGTGAVFKLTPSGTLSLLHRFCSEANCSDGLDIYSGLVLGTDGNLYGATWEGGAYSYGTIFKITLGGSLTTVYNFCSVSSCLDGSFPFGGLVEGTDGNFYGTTAGGGAANAGTVFRINPRGELTTLHSFNLTDGISPIGALAQDIHGDFYGVTWKGGYGYGTVFKITRSGILTTIHNFDVGDGAYPFSSLMQDLRGNFYGTTTAGGKGANFGGTIYRISPSGIFKTLYSFCVRQQCTTGGDPTAPLLLGIDGNLYGTAPEGGNLSCSGGCGTIFQLGSSDGFVPLYSFCPVAPCVDGYAPTGGLLQDTNGLFYGTTWLGGENSGGVAFSLDMGLSPFVTFSRPAGKFGQRIPVLGQGFTGTISVAINGSPANFTVVSDTYLKITIPAGATTGYITVNTPNALLTSNVPFFVLP